MPGVWVFPGGVIEPGERPEERGARAEEETGIALGDDAELHVWARWITPRSSRCASTLTSSWASPGASARARTAARSTTPWAQPARRARGPSRRSSSSSFRRSGTLETLLPFADAAEVIEAARDRVVEPILLAAGARERHRVLLPGDDGYEDAAPDTDSLTS